MVINLILGILFCKVLSNENKEHDWETRKLFARYYLILGVFVNAVLSICAFVVGWLQFSNWCWDHFDEGF